VAHGVAATGEHALQVVQHADHDVAVRCRFEEALVPRNLAVGDRFEQGAGTRPIESHATVERVVERGVVVGRAHEEVCGHPDADQLHADPARHLDHQHRQADGDTGAPLDHPIETRVAPVVVGAAIADEVLGDEQVVGHPVRRRSSTTGCERVEHREPHRRLQTRLDRAGDQQCRFVERHAGSESARMISAKRARDMSARYRRDLGDTSRPVICDGVRLPCPSMFPGAHLDTHGDKPALIMGGSGFTQTYRELDAAANRLSRLLRSAGLQPGDHIAICMENHDRYLEVVWGCHYAGLVYTCASSRLTSHELEYILNDCGARAYITSKYKADQATEIIEPRRTSSCV
jgi:hypothetical protein